MVNHCNFHSTLHHHLPSTRRQRAGCHYSSPPTPRKPTNVAAFILTSYRDAKHAARDSCRRRTGQQNTTARDFCRCRDGKHSTACLTLVGDASRPSQQPTTPLLRHSVCSNGLGTTCDDVQRPQRTRDTSRMTLRRRIEGPPAAPPRS